MKIYRNSEGVCVNIGEWDYCALIEQYVTINEDGEEVLVDVDVIRNPMPDDLVESDEEVVVGWDGGLYVHDDQRQYGA